jgi:hypothetical protein
MVPAAATASYVEEADVILFEAVERFARSERYPRLLKEMLTVIAPPRR